MIFPLIVLLFFGGMVFLWVKKKERKWMVPTQSFPTEWRIILLQEVSFYVSLNEKEKDHFEYKVHEFLLNCRITGVRTDVTITHKILVASSAIIPVFSFTNWKYTNINEVLIYPDVFNQDFETTGPDRTILGMVGNGYMEGLMILSKKALVDGFRNDSDKKNTAVHEFVHLIDKMDGNIDGIPEVLMQQPYVIPWLDLVHNKINQIHTGNSDINKYGATNKAEFFSVACEYFFERPKLMEKKHPELYEMLEEMFNQDMTKRNLRIKKRVISRNAPCPCNSGVKFKKCCGVVHYRKAS